MSVLRRRRPLALLAFGAALTVAVWTGVALGVRLAYADKILVGTNMAGANLGGRSPDDARRLLAGARHPSSAGDADRRRTPICRHGGAGRL